MSGPVVDEVLVTGWMDALAEPVAGPVPAALVQRWRAGLLAAVTEAREPTPPAVSGRYQLLDRYLTGITAGLAAAVGTAAPADGGVSEPIILAAGLLAGSAALQVVPAGYETDAGSAAAAAMVDAAASGAPMVAAVEQALRAAGRVRARSMVGIALDALLRALTGGPADEPDDGLFEVRLLLEPTDPRVELETVALDRMLDGLTEERRWIPDATGFGLVLLSRRPGPLIETVFAFGRVRRLHIRHLS